MQCTAIVEIIRHSVDASFGLAKAYQPLLSAISLLTVLVSLVTLLLALSFMMWSYSGLGVPIRFRAIDKIALAMLLLLCASSYFVARSFPHSGSAWTVIGRIEYADPALFALGSIIAVRLYRTSSAIGASALSKSLLWLVLEFCDRLLAFASLTGSRELGSHLLHTISTCLYWYSPWLFLLAILARADVALQATLSTQRGDAPDFKYPPPLV